MLSRVSQKSMSNALRQSVHLRSATITPTKRSFTSLIGQTSYINAQTSSLNNSIYRRWASTSVPVPPMAESLTEGSLKDYTKAVGEFIKEDELLATIETDKIDIEVNSPVSGTITKLNFQPEDTVTVGDELAQIEEGAAPEGGAAPATSTPTEAAKEKAPTETAKVTSSSPAAPKKEAPAAAPASTPKKETPATSSATDSFTPFARNESRVKMNRMRLRIAERLKESQNTAASLTTFNEVDMSALLEMRKLYKDEIIKKTGTKFGFMGLFSKACTLAAKDIPAINGAIEGDQIVYRDFTDISVAVATPKGLVTPVVRNAESLSVLGIEDEIVRLSHKARDGKLTLEDMTGGTFTISNGGVFGSLYGTPIINTPQTAVLGLHGVKERPVTINGQIVSRPMMYMALTYDHRLVDGREAVTFLKTVKELIEDPRKMLLF
ncbi:similar to Saccharomyces cerevisiae YDR148C KGD2 Dihydrolipoyl transsuccinylase [Maudiozyma saulgeensis]|uniref:dihydrolipoyllysine-residue succinyltransferase n=1 Tax=Maudiozyma saulgeensis TaxID=1789683 RepID=A0A1X7R625_9SACH|nr:similar to Saccharomyces cerevisiae YDR148C KGD2 Dihydrolipoyl transsuccinylase [Kazachstania saulgeensis]